MQDYQANAPLPPFPRLLENGSAYTTVGLCEAEKTHRTDVQDYQANTPPPFLSLAKPNGWILVYLSWSN